MEGFKKDDSYRLRSLETKFERFANELAALGITPGRATTKSQNTFEHIIQLIMQLRVHVLSGISVSQQLNQVVKLEKKELFFDALVKSLSTFDQAVVLSNYWGMAAEAKKKSENSPLEPIPAEKFQSFLTPTGVSESEIEKLKQALNRWISSDPTVLDPQAPPKKNPSEKRKAEANLFSSDEEISSSQGREKKKPEKKKKKEKEPEKKKKEKKKESSKSKKISNEKSSKSEETSSTLKKSKPKVQLNNGKAFLEGKEIPIETLLRIHRIPFTPAKVADEKRETMLSQATVSGDPRLEDETPEPGLTGPADPNQAFISGKSVLSQMEED